jgi:hypothetical protein
MKPGASRSGEESVLVDRLHELAIRVELQLSGGSIADTDGARVTIADERQRAFRRVACAVEPIQGVQPWQGPVGSRGGSGSPS